jgi:CHAD domain-containing protein
MSDSAPGFPPGCDVLVRAIADAIATLDQLQDTLLEIHDASTEPDAVRMRAAEGLQQIEQGRRCLTLEEDEHA